MKKEQKIIELRTAARQKVAEIETKIAFARSEAAGKRARLMWERAAELDGLEAGGTERFNVLAKYRTKLAVVNEQLDATVAQLKYEIQQTRNECERQCAAAEDDHENDTEKNNENENDVTVKGFQPQQQTVYCDGSEHSARIVARRMINKMPHIPKNGYLFVHVIRDDDGDYFVSISARGKSPDDNIVKIFSKGTHTAESEAEFVEEAREMLTPMRKRTIATATLQNLFHELWTRFSEETLLNMSKIISDTIKDEKEGGNE